MRPLQYAIYKGMGGQYGALQLNFQSPHYFLDKKKDFVGTQAVEVDATSGIGSLRPGWSIREGAVFIEITSAVGKNQYDWDKKIVMALSVDDMGKVLNAIGSAQELELMHDPGAKTESQSQVKKYLKLSFPDVTKGAVLTVTKIAGGERVNHMVPISRSELIVIRSLLTSAVSHALGW